MSKMVSVPNHSLLCFFFLSLCVLGRELDIKYLPRTSSKNNLKHQLSNETGDFGDFRVMSFGGSYSEPMDATPNSNHTNRKLKQNGCSVNSVKITVAKFVNMGLPTGCLGFDPSLGSRKCQCSWYRYAFSNECYSDIYAARWRNCGIQYMDFDKSPFVYSGTKFSSKLHKCCPFSSFFSQNPQYVNRASYKVCRLNVSPWGSGGVQIKQRYTVFFWYCSDGASVLMPVMYYFRNGLKFRDYPPFSSDYTLPSYTWYTISYDQTFSPDRFRDWPSWVPRPKSMNDPSGGWVVADTSGDYAATSYAEPYVGA